MKKAPVSDHALLRYLERVVGLNIDDCKRHMVTPEIADAIKAGCKSIRQGGNTYIIDGGKVITVIDGTGSYRD